MSTTTTKKSIRVFDPFSLNYAPDTEYHTQIQFIIAYGDSRLRKALETMTEADSGRQKWMQKCLLKETRFFLEYVGMATALSLAIEVPIILRSLANALRFSSEDGKPLPYDFKFLATLAIGTQSNHLHQTVPSYKQEWWCKRKPTKTMDHILLPTSLQYHEGQLSALYPSPPSSPQPAVDDVPRLRPPSASPPPGPKIDLLQTPRIPVDIPGVDSECPMCKVYHSLAVDLLHSSNDDINDIQALAQVAQNEIELQRRRGSGYYTHFEAAVIVDSEEASQSSIPSAWTGGRDLTAQEVLGLGRPRHLNERSGYGTMPEHSGSSGIITTDLNIASDNGSDPMDVDEDTSAGADMEMLGDIDGHVEVVSPGPGPEHNQTETEPDRSLSLATTNEVALPAIFAVIESDKDDSVDPIALAFQTVHCILESEPDPEDSTNSCVANLVGLAPDDPMALARAALFDMGATSVSNEAGVNQRTSADNSLVLGTSDDSQPDPEPDPVALARAAVLGMCDDSQPDPSALAQAAMLDMSDNFTDDSVRAADEPDLVALARAAVFGMSDDSQPDPEPDPVALARAAVLGMCDDTQPDPEPDPVALARAAVLSMSDDSQPDPVALARAAVLGMCDDSQPDPSALAQAAMLDISDNFIDNPVWAADDSEPDLVALARAAVLGRSDGSEPDPVALARAAVLGMFDDSAGDPVRAVDDSEPNANDPTLAAILSRVAAKEDDLECMNAIIANPAPFDVPLPKKGLARIFDLNLSEDEDTAPLSVSSREKGPIRIYELHLANNEDPVPGPAPATKKRGLSRLSTLHLSDNEAPVSVPVLKKKGLSRLATIQLSDDETPTPAPIPPLKKKGLSRLDAIQLSDDETPTPAPIPPLKKKGLSRLATIQLSDDEIPVPPSRYAPKQRGLGRLYNLHLSD